jgi:dipeptidyl aminopeptidase/acylaminoacyl peptidase
VELTNTPNVRNTRPRFAPDGKTIALMVRAKDAPNFDLALMDFDSRRLRRLTQEKDPRYNWAHVAFSPDGKTLYANRGDVGLSDQDVFRIDVVSGKAENLTPHTGKVIYSASAVFPDGKTLLIDSSLKDGYKNVALLDVATKKLRWATDVKWAATAGDVSPDGQSFTYWVNDDGKFDVYLCERATLNAERLDLGGGLNSLRGRPTSFSPDGRRILIGRTSSQRPDDIWIWNVRERKVRQLSFSAIASIDPSILPPAQIVHYSSVGGRMISALLWVPFNLKRDGTNPAVVLAHGGPTAQQVDYWNPAAAALATRGYLCIAPNPRGSTGYGLEFQLANVKDLGGGDLVDEVNAVEFLKETGFVDPRRIGIFGGSYGGFMTLMAIGKTPDVWAAGVSRYGIINWVTMSKHTDPLLSQYARFLLGDPDKDRKIYEDASPIKYIRQAQAPLLVLQGDNDVRVPKEEAEQLVEILKSLGKTVEVHYYSNEGHGFMKRETRIDALRRTVDWFDRYLRAPRSGAPRP